MTTTTDQPTSTPTENATAAAIARREDSPGAMVQRYREDFTSVMPSHIKPEAWVRIAVGALKKGKRLPNGQFELEVAAANNPGVFLASLLDAARLGLEPGTEQYYLTPRKVKGQLEILGIVGYQGIVELMYRAGAISSVVAEVVHEHDLFEFQPGRDEIPRHEIDWDAPDRGRLRLVYAFARMKDGATSKVVVMNALDIERIKASSQGANTEYSPWTKHEASMWLKSAVRQLAKWVPTSAEYVLHAERLRADMAQQEPARSISGSLLEELPDGTTANRSTGEVLDSERIIDAELGEDPVDGEIAGEGETGSWPETAPIPS